MTGHSKPLPLSLLTGASALALLAVPLGIKLLRSGRESRSKSRSFDYEFGGPVGAYATMLSLPGIVLFLYYGCGRTFVLKGLNFQSLKDLPLPAIGELCSPKSLAICSGWFGFQVLLERLLPGPLVEGVELPGGRGKLKYCLNGHKAFWVSLLSLAGVQAACRQGGQGGLAVLYDLYPSLAGSSMLLTFGLSCYLYFSSFSPQSLLAAGGDSGNAIYDFFIGRELNPRIGSFDLKEFCELRPGLIGWLALNLGMMAKQYQNTGSITPAMALVTAMQGLYVWDALYQEKAILSTMDITTDGFGHMLCFGDMAWVPFTYGLQARYLVDHDPGISPSMLLAIAALGLGGYVIFRASNSQKDAFRTDPKADSVRHLDVLEVQNLQTGRPGKLLVSGWWGLARKINYTGDWLMAWSWSATTGCPFLGQGSLLTYFYPIYFAVLLIHRAGRDDHFCRLKYGTGWVEYKKRVPYLFVPYLI